MFYYEYIRDDPSQKLLYFKAPLTAEKHVHKGIELIAALDGAVKIGYNNTIMQLQKGDVIFIPALTEHSIDAPTVIALLLIPVAYLDFYEKNVTATRPKYPIITSERSERILYEISRFDEINVDNTLKVYSQIYKVLDTAADMLDFVPRDPKDSPRFTDLLSNVTQYIENHYMDEDLSVNTLSSFFGYHYRALLPVLLFFDKADNQ